LSKEKLGEEYLAILEELKAGSKTSLDLASRSKLPRMVVAGFLATLVKWGYIREVKPRLYEIVDRGLEALERGVKPRALEPLKITLQEPIRLESILSHEEAQIALLQTGNLLGFDTYTADRSKECRGIRLGDLAGLKEISPFTLERLLKTVREIDVIWFKEEFPRYCFEVEHTTGVRDGLLRLYQIRDLSTKFFIVAPQDVILKFKTEIQKDPFYRIKERYEFKTYEELFLLHNAVVKYDEQKNRFGIHL